MALETTQKYLDWYGLGLFWNKLRQYITNQILGIDGTKILLDNNANNSPTVSSQIEDIWNAIGDTGDGSLSGNIENILGAYVKSVEGTEASSAIGQETYLGIGYDNEGIKYDKTSGAVDIKLKLDETKLKQKFQQIDGVTHVNSIKVTGSNGINATGAENQVSGDVEITIDATEINNTLSEIQSSFVKSLTVSDTKQGGNDYVNISGSPTTGDVSVTINDSKLSQKIGEMDLSIGNNASNIAQEITNRTNADDALSERIDELENNSYVNGITTTDGTYVKISPDQESTGVVNIVINDNTVVEKITALETKIINATEVPYASDTDATSTYTKIESIVQDVSGISSSYVQSFGGKNGVITIDNDASTAGSIKFAMNENELQGSVQGLGGAAYETLSTYTAAQIEAIFS